jgi:hypothetical protein
VVVVAKSLADRLRAEPHRGKKFQLMVQQIDAMERRVFANTKRANDQAAQGEEREQRVDGALATLYASQEQITEQLDTLLQNQRLAYVAMFSGVPIERWRARRQLRRSIMSDVDGEWVSFAGRTGSLFEILWLVVQVLFVSLVVLIALRAG